MLTVTSRDTDRIRVVIAYEPFAMDELAEAAERDLANADPETVFGMPLVVDFRAVDLLKFTAQDFRRVIRKRLALDGCDRGAPCAMVAACDASFGMLRMYAAYAEVAELRPAGRTFVTLDMAEALRWVAAQMPADPTPPV